MEPNSKMKGLYDNLSKVNILRQCKPLFEPPYGRGVLYLDPETNLITAGRKRIQMDSSWIMNKTPVGHSVWLFRQDITISTDKVPLMLEGKCQSYDYPTVICTW